MAASHCASSIWTETAKQTSASTAVNPKPSTATRSHTTTTGSENCPHTTCRWGVFGENFTTDGLLEASVHPGDRFSVGSAEVVVTQPRLPCYKLGVRFQSDDMVKRFLASGRTGFYLAVTREGEVGAGDEIELIAREPDSIPISEITRLYLAKTYGDNDIAYVQRALQLVALPEGWKRYFQERLQRADI
ncbi:MAG: MOSC domain-containing protein [Candidatus Korobacteraceae bacterium]